MRYSSNRVGANGSATGHDVPAPAVRVDSLIVLCWANRAMFQRIGCETVAAGDGCGCRAEYYQLLCVPVSGCGFHGSLRMMGSDVFEASK